MYLYIAQNPIEVCKTIPITICCDGIPINVIDRWKGEERKTHTTMEFMQRNTRGVLLSRQGTCSQRQDTVSFRFLTCIVRTI